MLLSSLLAAADAAPRISVNATTISAGDAVRVSWSGVALDNLPPMRVAFYDGLPHQHLWRGFSHMRVFNATHLTLDFYADAPLDATAPIHHSVTLERAFPRV